MAFSIDAPRLAFDTPTGRAGVGARTLSVYLALAALQVLDVATTWVILANWTARAEGNPIVAGLIDHTGLVVAMVALLVTKLAVVRVLYEKQTGVKLMSAVYGLVVANNLLFLGLWLFG
ncbi:MAG: DUF5658 family protein [Acidimicrobiales bacterium]|nr:DUF5658 family protein [Acidimicrobiales bacterium]